MSARLLRLPLVLLLLTFATVATAQTGPCSVLVCDPLTQCIDNGDGTAQCSACPEGYTGSGETACVDVDECLVGTFCSVNASCTNQPGSYVCVCNDGYEGDGVTCNDIDECATDNGGCDPVATCTNSPGSYSCGPCPEGYTGTGDMACNDIDECATNNGGCDALTTCTNTPGSRTCGACPTGYTGNGYDGCVAESTGSDGGTDAGTGSGSDAGTGSGADAGNDPGDNAPGSGCSCGATAGPLWALLALGGLLVMRRRRDPAGGTR